MNISTDSELFKVRDYLPYNMWLLMFMEAQWKFIVDTVLCQDYQITMLVLKNSRNSCTSDSRHVIIRRFFVKDRVEKKEANIENLLTQIL